MAKGIGHWYIEVRKQAYWRGALHTWVNRYVMSGSDPTSAQATQVIGIIKGIENKLHPLQGGGGAVGFLEGSAYGSAGGPPFAVVTYATAGATTGGTGFAGLTAPTGQQWAPQLEVCLLLETRLNGLSASGKPVSLRKFYRGNMFPNEDYQAGPIGAADLAQIASITAPFQTGMGDNNWVVIGTSGKQAAAAPAAKAYLVNRQIPKGKSRKKSSGNGGGVLGDLTSALGALGGAATVGEGIGAVL